MLEKSTGILLITGSLLFLIAAFMPVTIQVITAHDSAQFIQYLQNDRRGWLLANLLFGAGSVAVAVGLALFAVHIQSLSDSTAIRLVSYAAAVLAGSGALLWVIIVYNRAALPPEQLVNNLSVNNWFFPAYTLLTQAALLLVGLVLLQTHYPLWSGGGITVVAILSIAVYLVFGDMPPFVHYLPLLVLGIVLAR